MKNPAGRMTLAQETTAVCIALHHLVKKCTSSCYLKNVIFCAQGFLFCTVQCCLSSVHQILEDKLRACLSTIRAQKNRFIQLVSLCANCRAFVPRTFSIFEWCGGSSACRNMDAFSFAFSNLFGNRRAAGPLSCSSRRDSPYTASVVQFQDWGDGKRRVGSPFQGWGR